MQLHFWDRNPVWALEALAGAGMDPCGQCGSPPAPKAVKPCCGLDMGGGSVYIQLVWEPKMEIPAKASRQPTFDAVDRKPAKTGVLQIPAQSPFQERYVLSNRWLVRADPDFHTPYSAYCVDTGETYRLSGIAFLILKILEQTCSTADELMSCLAPNGVALEAGELAGFLTNLLQKNLIRGSETAPLPHLARRPCPAICAPVPVTATPYEAEVHLTNACNLACRHCAYDAGREIPNQLDTEGWLDVFDQFETLRTCRAAISGGEPLLYPEVNILLEHLTRKNIRIDLLTNGTLIDPVIAAYLSHPNFSTTVSLDGASEETHAILRGSTSFNRAIAGLKVLSDAGAALNITAPLHKRNLQEMEDIIRIGIRLHAKSVGFVVMDSIGRARNQKDLLLDPADIDAIEKSVERLSAEYGNDTCIEFFNPSEPRYKDLSITGMGTNIYCPAGTTRVAIRSDGVLFPCVYAFDTDCFAMGSTRRESIEDIWLSKEWGLFRGGVQLGNLKACGSCKLAETCTLKICRLRAYYAEGDFLGRPPGCRQLVSSTPGMSRI